MGIYGEGEEATMEGNDPFLDADVGEDCCNWSVAFTGDPARVGDRDPARVKFDHRENVGCGELRFAYDCANATDEMRRKPEYSSSPSFPAHSFLLFPSSSSSQPPSSSSCARMHEYVRVFVRE